MANSNSTICRTEHGRWQRKQTRACFLIIYWQYHNTLNKATPNHIISWNSYSSARNDSVSCLAELNVIYLHLIFPKDNDRKIEKHLLSLWFASFSCNAIWSPSCLSHFNEIYVRCWRSRIKLTKIVNFAEVICLLVLKPHPSYYLSLSNIVLCYLDYMLSIFFRMRFIGTLPALIATYKHTHLIKTLGFTQVAPTVSP